MTTAHSRGRALGRGFQPLAAPADIPALPLADRAVPGVEELADTAVEAACALADFVTPSGWSAGAVEDVLDAIETLAAALPSILLPPVSSRPSRPPPPPYVSACNRRPLLPKRSRRAAAGAASVTARSRSGQDDRRVAHPWQAGCGPPLLGRGRVPGRVVGRGGAPGGPAAARRYSLITGGWRASYLFLRAKPGCSNGG
ncbi:hypothetical protein [Streptomyces triculaminicus]|uniref:hypothetical protein n=1 Tax=Streptomyces triculaminicus TaxID=2816232 RepID=UPI0037D59C26